MAHEKDRDSKTSKLFDGVGFAIVEDDAFDHSLAQSVTNSMQKSSAQLYIRINSQKPFPPEVTHIISKTSDFPGYHDALDSLVSVVKPDPDPRFFFSGLVFAIVGLPAGDFEAISGGVLAAGGQISMTMNRTVTHVISLSDQSELCQKVTTSTSHPIIQVLPHWIDDCFKLGRRIDTEPYKVPHPDIMSLEADLPIPIPTNALELSVFKGKRVRLGDDLDLNSRSLDILKGLISQKGRVVDDVEHANMLVCRYREGDDFDFAVTRGIEIGNLSWLYHLMTHDKWTSPMRRLLHFPVPRNGVPGIQGCKIAVSNYSGEVRSFYIDLIKAAGATFTKTLKQDENTHLITARDLGNKCDAARAWNINLLNGLWLEESYSQMRALSLTNQKYSHFPERTNLGEVAGQAQIDPKVIKSLVTAHNHDTVDDDSSESNDHSSNPVDTTNSDKRHSLNVAALPSSNSSVGRKHAKAHRHTTSPLRDLTASSDNAMFRPSSGRGAKERATSKLQEWSKDIALYQKERKRKGGVERGGRRNPEDMVPTRRTEIKEDRNSDADDEDESEREQKRQRMSLPPVTMKLLVTSYSKWTEFPRHMENDKRILRDLGILVVNDPAKCSHLAAPHIVRTPKFFSALSRSPIVLNTTFLDRCLSDQEYADPRKFLLKDEQQEKRYDFRLSEALARAKANKGRLLSGVKIYAMPEVNGGFEKYKQIIEANGGSCVPFRRRHGDHFVDEPSESNELSEEEESQFVYLLSGTTKEEVESWFQFNQMVNNEGLVPRIAKTDWLIDAALSQELRWKADRHQCDVSKAKNGA